MTARKTPAWKGELDECFDADGLAEYLHTDREAIYRLIRDGLAPEHFRPTGAARGRVLFRKSKVLAWVERREAETAA